MRTLLAALTALMLFATPVVAGEYDHQRGWAAYKAGNYREALRFFTNSSNEAGSQGYIGDMYYKGQGAAEWYLKAAKQGSWGALHKLGLMYAKGQGVDQSDIEAYAWWSAAAETRGWYGNDNQKKSEAARDTLAQFMSEGDLAKAKKLAGDYWKKYVLY